jgi:hypothetical protein
MSRRTGVLAVMSTEMEMSPTNPASDWRYDDVGR